MKLTLFHLATLALILVLVPAVQADFTNGGFESGLSGWSTSGFNIYSVTSSNSWSSEGTYSAKIDVLEGGDSSSYGSISQTVDLTGYTWLNFTAKHDFTGDGDPPGELRVYLNGSVIYTDYVSADRVTSYSLDISGYPGYKIVSLEVYIPEESYRLITYFDSVSLDGIAIPEPGGEYNTTDGYWTLSVNQSQIDMEAWINGQLTETDPDNNYDKIEWTRDDSLQYSYFYDAGFLGFGAGWKRSDQGTNYQVIESNTTAAFENAIRFSSLYSGTRYFRVKVYDDVSIFQLLGFHDYHLVADLEIPITVTAGAFDLLSVEVWDSESYAMVLGASVTLTDTNTGATSTQTYQGVPPLYFSVYQGHYYHITGTAPGYDAFSDYFTATDPPGFYEMGLVPSHSSDAGNSTVSFNVYQGGYGNQKPWISGATVRLNTGDTKITNEAGYVYFTVLDNTPYTYIISRTGYNSVTGSFNISADTNYQVPIYLVPVTTTPTTVPGTLPGGQTVTPTPNGTTPYTSTDFTAEEHASARRTLSSMLPLAEFLAPLFLFLLLYAAFKRA